jgi:signal peptidase I
MAKKRKRERVYGTQSAGTPSGAGARPDDQEREARGAGGSMWEGLKSLLLALVLFLILRSFVLQNFVITSGSMERTLLVGDFLMVNRLALGGRIPFTQTTLPGYSEPRRFDVIVFDPPHEENLKLVKRLIGMPGDTLLMENRLLYINGELVDEPWVQHSDVGDQIDPWMDWQKSYLVHGTDQATYRPTRDNWGPIVIPEDRYFMLGDNRETSLDSRYWGLLERWRLEGRAVFIYFSYNKGSFRPFPWVREIRWNRIGDGID